MNPIVAQRQLLREIPDEVLQSQPQARYESPPADPVYLKVCLARHHLRQLVAAQKVALGRPSPYADRRTLTDPHVGNCARFINTTTARLVAQFPPRFSAHTHSLSAHPRSGGCNGRNVPIPDLAVPSEGRVN